jgi:biopolymer transport protein ExbB
MLDNRRLTLLAALGALALMTSAPALAQDAPADPDAATAPADAAATPDATAPAAAAPGADATTSAPVTLQDSMNAGKGHELTPWTMWRDATIVPKVVMAGLVLASVLSWILMILKAFEFSSLNRASNRFLEAFRTAKSIQEMGKIASSEEFEGNPLADMAYAAAQEVELSRSAGLAVTGEHRDSTLSRAYSAVGAVQTSLAKRLSSGMQYQASLGSTGPFVGLFGTVYGVMNSFIGIVKTQTTSLASVAPGIAEALLATGIGLFAAIPAVVAYNYFQTRISGFGGRTEGFVAELMNAISRQLDKGA